MQTVEQGMSRAGKVGFALVFSGVTGAIWYMALSYATNVSFRIPPTQFQPAIAIGFATLSLLGLALFWPERRIFKIRASKQINEQGFLSEAMINFLALSGVAHATLGTWWLGCTFALDDITQVATWVWLAAGLLIFLLGIILAWKRRITKEAR
jgi:hypothetical protein